MPLALPGLVETLARGLDAFPAALELGTNLYRAAAPGCDRCMNRGLVIDGATGELTECTCAERRRRARRYLRRDGVRVALELARPGLGTELTDAYDRARSAVRQSRAILSGDDADQLDRPPWRALQRSLRAATWGSFPIFGRRGGGKTMTALRLAEVAAIEQGYPVEAVNMWPEDLPGWIDPVPISVLIERRAIVDRALELGHVMRGRRAIDGRSKVAREARRLSDALEDMRGRVVLIDEMSLIDAGPRSLERLSVQWAMNMARHLSWVVVYVGQLMSQVPKSVLTSDCVILKSGGSDEEYWDRDEPGARHLWQSAAAGFEAIRGDPRWWREPYDVPQAWCYVRSRAPIDYDGMMPIRLPEAV